MAVEIKIPTIDGITLKTKEKYCTDDLAISLKEDLIPRGTYPISDNGEYDITNYEKVFVNVNKNIPSGQIEITENGEYNITTLESVIVNVTEPEDSFVKNNIPTTYSNDRVEEIGDFAFFNSKTLTEVNIPNVKKIGYGAFAGCNSLNKFVIEQDDVICTIDDYTSPAVFTYTTTGDGAITNGSIPYYADYGVCYFDANIASWGGIKFYKNGELLTKANATFAGNYYLDSTECDWSGKLYWSPNTDNDPEKNGLLISWVKDTNPARYRFTIDPDTTSIYIERVGSFKYKLTDVLGETSGYAVLNAKEEYFEYETSFVQWANISFTFDGAQLNQDNLIIEGDFYNENHAPWDNRLYFASDRTSLWCSKYAGGIYNFKYYYNTNKLVITAKDLSDIRVNTFENVYKLYGIQDETYNPEGLSTFKIIVPASRLMEYKESWLNYSNKIIGFADLYEGEQFPSYINDIYVLDNWYEDEQMTIKVDRSTSLDVLESKRYYYNIAKQ